MTGSSGHLCSWSYTAVSGIKGKHGLLGTISIPHSPRCYMFPLCSHRVLLNMYTWWVHWNSGVGRHLKCFMQKGWHEKADTSIVPPLLTLCCSVPLDFTYQTEAQRLNYEKPQDGKNRTWYQAWGPLSTGPCVTSQYAQPQSQPGPDHTQPCLGFPDGGLGCFIPCDSQPPYSLMAGTR